MALTCQRAGPVQAPVMQTASSVLAAPGMAFAQGGPALRRVATATAILQANAVAAASTAPTAARSTGRAPPPAGAAVGTASAMNTSPSRLSSVTAPSGALGTGMAMRPVAGAVDPLQGSRRSSSVGARKGNLVAPVGYEASGQPEAGRWKATGGGSTSSTMSWETPAGSLWHAKVQASPAGSGTYAIGTGAASPQGGSARVANGMSFQYGGGSSLVSSDGGSHKVPQGTHAWSSVAAMDVMQGGSGAWKVGSIAHLGGSKAAPFVSLSPAASREGSLKLAAGTMEIGGHAASALTSASAPSDAKAPPAVPYDAAGTHMASPALGGSQRVPPSPWRSSAASHYVAAPGTVAVPFVSSVPSSNARSYSAMPSRPAPIPSPRGMSPSKAASTGQLPSAPPPQGLTNSQAGSAGRLPVGPPSQPGSHGRLPIGPAPQGGSAGRLPVGPAKEGLLRSGSSGRLPPGTGQQGLARSQSANSAQLAQSLAPLTGSGRASTGANCKSINSNAYESTTLSDVNRHLAKHWRVPMVAPAGTPTQVLPYVPPGKTPAETREPSPDQVLVYVPPGSEGGSEKFSLTPSPTMQYREVQVPASGLTTANEVDMASKLRLLENEVLRLNRMLEEEQKVSASLRGALEEGAKATLRVTPGIDGSGNSKADISEETEAVTVVDESRIEERLSDATLSPAPWHTFSPPRPLGSTLPPGRAIMPFPQVEDGSETPAQYQFSFQGHDGNTRDLDDSASRNGSPSEDRVESAAFAAVERLRSMNDHGGAAIAEKILASLRTGPGNSRRDSDKDPLQWDPRQRVESG